MQALPQSVWKELEKKVLATSPLDVRAQRNILRFYSSAHEVDLDVHGRVLVPPALRAPQRAMSAPSAVTDRAYGLPLENVVLM